MIHDLRTAVPRYGCPNTPVLHGATLTTNDSIGGAYRESVWSLIWTLTAWRHQRSIDSRRIRGAGISTGKVYPIMWKRATTALLLLFTTGVAVLANPAAAQTRPAAAGQEEAVPMDARRSLATSFRLRNYKSKLYLQNAGSISNGTAVSQHPRNTNGYQEWREIADGQYSSFMHVKSGLNLGINRGNTLPGAKAILANGSGAFNQDWEVFTRPGDVLELRNRASGLCLGIYDASTAAGAVAAQFPCDGGANQGWEIKYVV